MSLSSNHLDAFSAVAKFKSFSEAAKKLNITQSALSQRILNLEAEIGSTLFLRESSGNLLTELGNRLLQYCLAKESLEQQFFSNLKPGKAHQLGGIIKIGSYSTLTNSILVPLLSKIIAGNPSLQVEIKEAEIRDLPRMLTSGGVDFIFLNQSFEKQGIENHVLGYEENVMVQSSGSKGSIDVYLDHDEDDLTTFDFMKVQGRKNLKVPRSYYANVHVILEAVKLGMGKAVMPLHIVEKIKGIEILPDFKTQKVPVYLTHYSMPYYTDLQKLLIKKFTEEIPKYLENRS